MIESLTFSAQMENHLHVWAHTELTRPEAFVVRHRHRPAPSLQLSLAELSRATEAGCVCKNERETSHPPKTL